MVNITFLSVRILLSSFNSITGFCGGFLGDGGRQLN